MTQTLTLPAAVPSDVSSVALPLVVGGDNSETAHSMLPNENTDPSGWHFVTGVAIGDATQLLDWLQNKGVELREIVFQRDGFVTVRWKV